MEKISANLIFHGFMAIIRPYANSYFTITLTDTGHLADEIKRAEISRG